MGASEEDPVASVTWMIRGLWVSLSIRAAIELGVIDALKAPRTVAHLAAATQCDPASLVRLVRVLADLGLVTVSVASDGAEPVVTRTTRGATLSRGHASVLRELALLHTSMPHLASWERLADAVRTGQAVFESVNGIGWWDFLSANRDEEAIFNAAMAGRGSDQAAAISAGGDLSGVSHIVDVGGGRGAMLAETLSAHPGLTGVLADRAEVAAAAEAYFAEVGLGDRARAVTIDFFDSVPTGGDVYTLANVLHDWPDQDAIRILQTVRAAMHPSARLWVIERVVDAAGRTGHELRDLHLIDLHMLVVFGARERTTAEYDSLLLSAGLSPGRLLPTDGPWNILETRPR